MKHKKLYCLSLLLIFSLVLVFNDTANASSIFGNKNREGGFSFGIGLGPSYHRLSIERNINFANSSMITNISPIAIPGFSTQSFTYLSIGKHWKFRTIAIVPFFNFSQYQLSIRERGANGDLQPERFRVVEAFKLGVPIDVIFTSDMINKKFNFYAMLGTYGHYNFFTTPDNVPQQDDILVNFREFDVGASTGVGFDFKTSYNTISIEVKYNFGLRNLSQPDNVSHVSNAIDKLFTRDLYLYIIIH